MRNFNILFTIVLVIVGAISGCGAGQPKGGEGISYFGAAWLTNERIIYTKQVETVKFNYGWIVEIGNNTSERIWTDYFICTMDLNGEDEKILKQFRFVEAGVEGHMPQYYIIEGDKKIKIPDMIAPLRQSDYSCNKDLIVFGTGSIYTMKPDGSEFKQVVERGGYPRLSPDGKLILYTAADPSALEAYEKYRTEFKREPPQGLPGSLWLINTDGTGKKKLVEPGSHGIWSPDRKRIAYMVEGGMTPEGKRDYDYIYIIDSDGQNPMLLKKGAYPTDWTSDGSMIMFEGGFFNILTNQWVKLPKLAQMPRYPRLSPDEEKIVGEPKGFDADICVTYMYVTEREKAIKVLKKTHFKKWDD